MEMIKSVKVTLVALILLPIIVFALIVSVFGYGYYKTKAEVKRVTEGYLEALIAQNYEKAFEYLYYYGDEGSPLSEEDAREMWVVRAKGLVKEGVTVKSVEKITYSTFELCPRALAEVVVTDREGQEIKAELYIDLTAGKIGQPDGAGQCGGPWGSEYRIGNVTLNPSSKSDINSQEELDAVVEKIDSLHFYKFSGDLRSLEGGQNE